MKQYHKYAGLDVHKERNEVVCAVSDGEIRVCSSISNDLHALEKLVIKCRTDGVVLHFVYKVGPCGFVIAKLRAAWGMQHLPALVVLAVDRAGNSRYRVARDATPCKIYCCQ